MFKKEQYKSSQIYSYRSKKSLYLFFYNNIACLQITC